MSAKLLRPLPLVLIVTAYLILGALYAVNTPAWQVPDEPAHFNYIRQLAAGRGLPVIAPGDWDNAYLEAIKAARFSEAAIAGRLDSVQYEDWQPPLYYLGGALLYTLGADLTGLRLYSVAVGALAVIAAWLVIRNIFPTHHWLANGAAAFIAFLPQHLAIMAGVGNDGLAELVVALILLLSIRYVQGRAPLWMSGALMGIGLFTKATTYPMAAVIGLAILLRGNTGRGQLLARFGMAFGLALLVGGWWFVRNLATYGGLDFMAQAAHDRVVVGQLTMGVYVAQHGIGGWISDGIATTFRSLWGQFGWMGVPMTDTIYLLLSVFTAAAASGAILAFVRYRWALKRDQWAAMLLLGATALLVTAAYVYYNLKFVQFQGRYLFPALIPIAFTFVSGVGGWVALIMGLIRPSLTRHVRFAMVTGFAVGMAGFALYALYRIVIPDLT